MKYTFLDFQMLHIPGPSGNGKFGGIVIKKFLENTNLGSYSLFFSKENDLKLDFMVLL